MLETTKDLLAKSRSWLEEHKIFFETIAATLISIMAVIVSYQQIKTAEKQNLILEQQTDINKKQFTLMSTQTVFARHQLDLTQKQIFMNNLQFENEKKYQMAQFKLSNRQNDLIDIQTDLAVKQFKHQEDIDVIKRRQDHIELNNAIHDYIWNKRVHPPFNEMSDAAKQQYFESILKLLESQRYNPLIVGNPECFKKWLHAIDTISTWALSTFNNKKIWHFPGPDPTDITQYIDSSKPEAFSTERDKYLGECAGMISKDIDFVYEQLITNQKEIRKLYTSDELKSLQKK